MNQIDDWREVVKLPVVGPVNPNWSLEELQETMVESVKNCVEFCLRREGSILMSLSGGLDSTLFLAITRRLFPHIPIAAFTITMDFNHPDRSFSKQAAETFGILHEFATFYPQHNTVPFFLVEHQFKEFSAGYPSHEGDIAVFTLYRMISRFQHFVSGKTPHFVIALDGIDEIHGGYWPHRLPEAEAVFNHLWERLGPDHLSPLLRTTSHLGIAPIFPYLQKRFVEYSAGIPVSARTSREESKILIRRIARNFGVPEGIINRPKVGFCDALKPSEILEAEMTKRR